MVGVTRTFQILGVVLVVLGLVIVAYGFFFVQSSGVGLNADGLPILSGIVDFIVSTMKSLIPAIQTGTREVQTEAFGAMVALFGFLSLLISAVLALLSR